MRQVLPLTGTTRPASKAWPLVEREALRLPGQGAAIHHGLAVVLPGAVEAVDPEQPPGRREEADVPQLGGERRVGHRERAVLDQARVGEAGGAGQREEVLPVQRAAQAFAVQHRIVAHRGGHAAVGIHVGEVELATLR